MRNSERVREIERERKGDREREVEREREFSGEQWKRANKKGREGERNRVTVTE